MTERRIAELQGQLVALRKQLAMLHVQLVGQQQVIESQRDRLKPPPGRRRFR